MISNYLNIDDLKIQLQKANERIEQVKYIAEYVLQHLKITSQNKCKSSTELFDEYIKIFTLYPESIPTIPKNTFAICISKIASQQSSNINCLGKKGYYLEALVDQLEQIEIEFKKNEEKDIPTITPETFQEKDTYPFLKSWMLEKDFDRVADISSLRGNGKWGNPDVMGLKIDEMFGNQEIEITTVEIKLTEDNWEQWIFEAISHTRFANRSYFCFMHPDNLINKLDSTEIKHYAEHYKIGILIIEIDDKSYLKIKEKSPVELNTDKIRIIEYYPAPFHNTNIKFRKKFMKSLDILEIGKLYTFGEGLQ